MSLFSPAGSSEHDEAMTSSSLTSGIVEPRAFRGRLLLIVSCLMALRLSFLTSHPAGAQTGILDPVAPALD